MAFLRFGSAPEIHFFLGVSPMSKRLSVAAACSALALIVGSIPTRASETQSYGYNGLGRLIWVQYAGTVENGQVHSICYDAANNRTEYESDSGEGFATCAPSPTPSPAPSPISTPTSKPTPTPIPTQTLSIGDVADDAGSTLHATDRLSAASFPTVTVRREKAYGTAGFADSTEKLGSLTFLPGQTSMLIAAVTKADIRVDSDEVFYVNLTNPSGGIATAARAS